MDKVLAGTLLAVVLLGGTGMAQQTPKRLTADQVKTIVAAVDLLELSATEQEKAMATDIKLKAYTVVFLRAEDGLDRKALAYLVERKASAQIAMGLQNSNLNTRVAAVRSLSGMGDTNVLPAILESIKVIRWPSRGGEESAELGLYCAEAIKAIETLTKQKFDAPASSTLAELLPRLEKAIKETLAEPKTSPIP